MSILKNKKNIVIISFALIVILIIAIIFNNLKGAYSINNNETILYDVDVQNYSLEEIKNIWKSNATALSRDFIIDGDESTYYKYLYYNPQTAKEEQGEDAKQVYFKITIDNLNIDASSQKDIRLHIDYATIQPLTSLIKSNGLVVYTYDNENNLHGPFYLDDYEPTGYYYYCERNSITEECIKNTNNQIKTERYLRGFSIITDNLSDGNGNYTINKIEILPYGNLPLDCKDDGNRFKDDWRCQSSYFYVKSIKVTGYSNNYEKKVNGKQVTYSSIDENEIRLDTAHRMYDLATIQWKPSIDMTSINTLGGFSFAYKDKESGEINYYYKKDNYYYGPLYTARNRVTVEKFYSALDKNKTLNALTEKYYFVEEKDTEGNIIRKYTPEMPKKEDDIIKENVELQAKNVPGSGCAASVSYSVSKFIPLNDMYTPSDFIWDRNKTTLLGGLTIKGIDKSSIAVYEDAYEKHLNEATNGSALKNNAADVINKRIKANVDKIKYNNYAIIDYLPYDYLAYMNTSSEHADGPLKLYTENHNIELNNNSILKIKVIYLKYGSDLPINPTFKVYSSSQDVTSNNISLQSNESKIGTYEYSNTKVDVNELTYILSNITDSSSTIDKIEFYPYGESTNIGGAFRLNELKIIKDSDATPIFTFKLNYFDFKNNLITKNYISADYLAAYNGDFTNTDAYKRTISAFLADQDIYKGYQELKIGDIVSTQSKEGSTHVRLITGNTHVECFDGTVLTVSSEIIDIPHGNCDNHGGINPQKSYFIRTDIMNHSIELSEETFNNFGGLITDNDYVAASTWSPNDKYTDLQSGDIMGKIRTGENQLYLNGKHVNYYINYKESFHTALSKSYLPIRLNSYIENKVEEPYATLFNPSTLENIKKGLKGSIYSNYPIISINISIDDNGNTKDYTIYPNHDAIYKEDVFVNEYSLYYNLPDDNNEINGVLQNLSDNFEVSVTVNVGTSEIEVLNLKHTGSTQETYTVTFNSDGGTQVSSQTVSHGAKATKPVDPTRAGYTFKGWKHGDTVYDFTTEVTSNITLKAEWEELLSHKLESKNYIINNNYIINIPLNKKISNLQSELGSDVIIEGEKDIISTGTIIRKNSQSYTVVVPGDISGDGLINSSDLLKVRKHLIHEITLDGAYELAGIYGNASKINSTSLLKIQKYLLNKTPID